jgi:uncharacterized protein YdeI (YjbR/CyaY-like superfamily)
LKESVSAVDDPRSSEAIINDALPKLNRSRMAAMTATGDSTIEDGILFESVEEWERFLAESHSTSRGVWVRISKKNSRVKSVTYQEALDTAICYGWIDGQKRKHDDGSWLQRFTPRRPKSGWSQINTGHAERLIIEGRMKDAGLKEVERAKEDGRWVKAYSPPSAATIPEDFLKALESNRKAKEFFETLNRANLYAIAYRLQTAKKAETRERRIKAIVGMLERGERFH